MLNQVVMIGGLHQEPTKEELMLLVPRNYKNKYVEYDDFSLIYHKINSMFKQNIHEGDLIGVKGGLETMKSRLKLRN